MMRNAMKSNADMRSVHRGRFGYARFHEERVDQVIQTTPFW